MPYQTDNYEEQGGATWVVGGELDIVSGGTFKIAGTTVSATAAELNSVAVIETAGTASTGVTAVETGNETRHTTILTVAAFTQAIATAALGFGKSIYTFPEGIVKVKYATVDLTIFGTAETGTPDIGIGTVIASGEIDTLNGTATFESIMDGFTATAITTTPGSASNKYVEAEAGLLDGHTTEVEAFLNFAETWAATENLTISATVTLIWDILGTY